MCLTEDESPTLFFCALPAFAATRQTAHSLASDLAALARRGYGALRSGDIDAAELHFTRALELCQSSDSTASALLPQAFGQLGVVAMYRGDLHRAATLFELGLEVARAVRTVLTAQDAMLLQNLGVVARRQGRLDEAERCHASALSLKVQTLGWSHPSVATTLVSLGFLRVHRGRASEALVHFDQAHEVLEHAGGERSREWAHVHIATGSAHLQLRDHSAAERCFLAALAIYAELPTLPVQLARARFLLARSLWSRDPRGARTLLETVLASYSHSSHPRTRHLQHMRAWLDGHALQAA